MNNCSLTSQRENTSILQYVIDIQSVRFTHSCAATCRYGWNIVNTAYNTIQLIDQSITYSLETSSFSRHHYQTFILEVWKGNIKYCESDSWFNCFPYFMYIPRTLKGTQNKSIIFQNLMSLYLVKKNHLLFENLANLF